MKLFLSALVAINAIPALASPTRSAAFVPIARSTKNNEESYASTRLFISSWGSAGPPGTRRIDNSIADPSESVQSYLSAPQPPTTRSNLDGTVLVSGFANAGDGSDQRIFDLLNDEGLDSAFRFDRILAFVDDVKYSKKRLVSRTARYSGLLNKLDFLEPEDGSSGLPILDQLRGVKSWVAAAEGGDFAVVKRICELAAEADVENVSILLMGVSSDLYADDRREAVKNLKLTGTAFTVVAVGEVSQDIAEGSYPYAVTDLGAEVERR